MKFDMGAAARNRRRWIMKRNRKTAWSLAGLTLLTAAFGAGIVYVYLPLGGGEIGLAAACVLCGLVLGGLLLIRTQTVLAAPSLDADKAPIEPKLPD